MIKTIIISVVTIVSLILVICIKPSIKIKNLEIQLFWIIPLVGALFLLLFGCIDFKNIQNVFASDNAINPAKILILFISISFLSIVLDEAGFFKKCAAFATTVTKGSQKKMFFVLFLIISILTIFTSNDIVILTFTPFICYFASHNKINPLPYLIGEFVFANTLSMLLIIGNPTNIYLANSFNIDFLTYLKIMAIPALTCGIVAYGVISLIFRKDLNKPLNSIVKEDAIKVNRFVMIIGLILLGGCTILLAIAGYIDIPMWVIAMSFAIIMALILIIYSIVKKDNIILKALKRLPWNLIPFVISMFIIVSSLDKNMIIGKISTLFNNFAKTETSTIFSYGIGAFLSCNILNNIPMSVMFERIIFESNQLFLNESLYSTIIASNIGAYLTPIGALAGIMWMSILNKMGFKMGFKKFVKYGIILSPVVLLVALLSLSLALKIFF